MSQYSKGADFERAVVKHLEKQGFLAFRCAGSKGNKKVDVIAICNEETIICGPRIPACTYRTLLIQCKLNGIASQFEKEQLTKAAEGFSCLPVLASKIEARIKFETLHEK